MKRRKNEKRRIGNIIKHIKSIGLFILIILIFSPLFLYLSYSKFDLDMFNYKLILSKNKINQYYEEHPLKDISLRLFNLFELNQYNLCFEPEDEERWAIIIINEKKIRASKENKTCAIINIDEIYSLRFDKFEIPFSINRSEIKRGGIIKVNPYIDFLENYKAYAEIKTRDYSLRVVLSYLAFFSIILLFKEIYKSILERVK